MTTSSPSFDVDFTTLAIEFQHASNSTEDTKIVGNAISLDRGLSLKYDLITGLVIIGVFGVLSNVSVLVVLLQKGNRKLATNCYLTNIAIGDILMSSSVSLRILGNFHINVWSAANCGLFVIVRFLPQYLGINSIMLVAVERFVAIVLPMRFRAFVAPRMMKLQLTFVWLLTFVELIFPAVGVKVSFDSCG
ncbi:hypothetical protein LSAT2_027467 [Lamellibrachia satsuma]|nr:hypothetical protein LSAT2_027467 [Lamellibrachia satsuma]